MQFTAMLVHPGSRHLWYETLLVFGTSSVGSACISWLFYIMRLFAFRFVFIGDFYFMWRSSCALQDLNSFYKRTTITSLRASISSHKLSLVTLKMPLDGPNPTLIWFFSRFYSVCCCILTWGGRNVVVALRILPYEHWRLLLLNSLPRLKWT